MLLKDCEDVRRNGISTVPNISHIFYSWNSEHNSPEHNIKMLRKCLLTIKEMNIETIWFPNIIYFTSLTRIPVRYTQNMDESLGEPSKKKYQNLDIVQTWGEGVSGAAKPFIEKRYGHVLGGRGVKGPRTK